MVLALTMIHLHCETGVFYVSGTYIDIVRLVYFYGSGTYIDTSTLWDWCTFMALALTSIHLHCETGVLLWLWYLHRYIYIVRLVYFYGSRTYIDTSILWDWCTFMALALTLIHLYCETGVLLWLLHLHWYIYIVRLVYFYGSGTYIDTPIFLDWCYFMALALTLVHLYCETGVFVWLWHLHWYIYIVWLVYFYGSGTYIDTSILWDGCTL